jgi:hypothetical protein
MAQKNFTFLYLIFLLDIYDTHCTYNLLVILYIELPWIEQRPDCFNRFINNYIKFNIHENILSYGVGKDVKIEKKI